MVLLRALLVAIVLLALGFGPQFGRWPGVASEDAALAAAYDVGASAGLPGFRVVAQDDNDNDEHIQTGGGQDAEDLGSSNGVVNPGAEDLGVKDDEDDDDDDD